MKPVTLRPGWTWGAKVMAVLAAPLIALTLVTLVLGSAPVMAHKASGSYLTLSVPSAEPVAAQAASRTASQDTRASGQAAAGPTITGRWDIALRDLDFALDLDEDGDGELTWGEVRARHADIADLARRHLKVTVDDRPCALRIGEQQLDSHTDGTYSVLPLTLDCGRPLRSLGVAYTLFADLDPQHRGLLQLQVDGRSTTAVLGGDEPQRRFDIGEPPGIWDTLLEFGGQGVWHIWIGVDHVLFLLSLLLPAVLVWQDPNWRAGRAFGPALADVVKVVTAFTLAHSITLSLASLQVVELPSRLVESSIAASVILAALNNIRPFFQGRRWAVAFAFGLIHGFGFATVLADLGLPSQALMMALLGFNLGVEVGQVAIVAVFLPLAWRLRQTAFYRQGVMTLGSLVIALLAAVWLIERLFDLSLLALF